MTAAPRSTPSSSGASLARSTTSAGPTSCSNLDVVRRILALTDRDDSLISYVTDRPGHDRRYSLSAARLEALGWSAQVHFDEGIERTVSWYRENESWWEPIRSGEYRDYYERQYGRTRGRPVSFRRLPTEIDGVVLVEPDVHGDERGFLVETYRAEAMSLVGIDVDFVQENHSRSSARVLRGLHLQRGQAKLVRCARGRIFDVAVDLRPGLPHLQALGGLRARRRRAPPALRPRRLRARLLRPLRSRLTSSIGSRATTTPSSRAASPGTTPRSRSTGRSRTRSSPIETGTLRPWRTWRLRVQAWGPVRAIPDGRCRPRLASSRPMSFRAVSRLRVVSRLSDGDRRNKTPNSACFENTPAHRDC